MGLTWTPWVIVPILALISAWGAAIVLLRTAPHRSLNRRLAFVLFLEGIWLGAGVFFAIDDPAVFLGIAAVAVGAMAALPFQYLSFLGASLSTPLVALFRSRIAFALLSLASAAMGLWVILFPWTFLGDLYSPEWATWNFQFRPAGERVALLHGVASLFGLVAAFAAFLKAKPGTDARSRAKWFMLAFGVRDLFNAVTWTLYPVLRPIPFWGDFVANQGPGIVNVLYVGLMSYGVLRAQLFDIDLKLKFALRQGTVGAVFTGAFFTGSELLERIVPVEGTILGLIVAGTIVLVLRPVHRFAETFASRVMRGVQDTPAYVESRKNEVYRATFEGTLEDGAITKRERAVLDRLREQLGISLDEAELIEREMLSAAG
jgi:hypothetical protein